MGFSVFFFCPVTDSSLIKLSLSLFLSLSDLGHLLSFVSARTNKRNHHHEIQDMASEDFFLPGVTNLRPSTSSVRLMMAAAFDIL